MESEECNGVTLSGRLELWWQRWSEQPRPRGWIDPVLESLVAWFSDRKIARHPIDMPVISVGGLTVGGAGKTPLVMHSIQHLVQQRKVAVISRGYRRDSSGLLVVSEGTGPCVSARQAGDEPWLIAHRCPQAMVLCAAERAAAIPHAIAWGAEVVVLDDGFQHRQLPRCCDLVCLPLEELGRPCRPFPLGRWRESLDALARAHVLMLMGGEAEQMQEWKQSFAMRFPKLHVCHGELVCSQWCDAKTLQATRAPQAGCQVACFAAIARPQRLVQSLRKQGLQITGALWEGDHRDFPHERLVQWASTQARKGATLLVCTEKDAVKGVPQLPLPVLYPQLELQVSCAAHPLFSILQQQIDAYIHTQPTPY